MRLNIPFEMNPSALDDWVFQVVGNRVPECFGRNADNVFLAFIERLELGFDSRLPISLHDILDSGFAEAVPFSPKAGLAYQLKGFVDEDTTAKTTF